MSKKHKNKQKKETPFEYLLMGVRIHEQHSLFRRVRGDVCLVKQKYMERNIPWVVTVQGKIYLNEDYPLSPREWAAGIAHCKLHLAFGHFDAEKMPGFEIKHDDGTKEKKVSCDLRIWNLACDLYIERFLADIKLGSLDSALWNMKGIRINMDELELYYALCKYEKLDRKSYFWDMEGLEHPKIYKGQERNIYAENFVRALADAVSDSVSIAGNHENMETTLAQKASQWFLNHYPLLGGLASAFHVIEDYKICQREEIQIAAVDVTLGEIYINPAARLSDEEMKFVLAHEYLHAGLQHYERCQGRNQYLWNVACDYVINGWLVEMGIGSMPEEGLLFDEKLIGMSAETIYDMILGDIRKFEKISTFRGYGKGDFFGNSECNRARDSISLDEFCKSALLQGLEYHQAQGRGIIPAGLIEEIRALAMPPIPWEVRLARWFDLYFPLLEKKRSYARPSRRQGATPDIPRPRYVLDDKLSEGRTFGVVVDTSGSMSTQMIGKALGSIASYAAAKEVPYARVIFCDAQAYDAGYLAPEEIAGRVLVKGRGGTILQPGIDLLESAKDFPKNGPILIITDGEIERKMNIHRNHAFLIPRGKRLPFKARGEVFCFE